jgi:hypothetical protein
MVVVASDCEAAVEGFGSVQIGEITGGETLDAIVFLLAIPTACCGQLSRSTRGNPRLTYLRRNDGVCSDDDRDRHYCAARVPADE